MKFEIIDFHTHPFIHSYENVCLYKNGEDKDSTLKIMELCGVSKFCGAVTSRLPATEENIVDIMVECNEHALELYDYYKGKYIPGVKVHPLSVALSKKYIDIFHAKGFNMVGEITPWSSIMDNTYNSDNMLEILDYASKKGMILSAHPTSNDDMDLLCENLKDLIIVGAHPSEGEQFNRHVLRAKKYENYYIDLSGSGIHRYKTTRKLIDEIGAHRVIFGSDYPICNLQMYVDGVTRDELLTDDEKRLILAENAKKLLKI